MGGSHLTLSKGIEGAAAGSSLANSTSRSLDRSWLSEFRPEEDKSRIVANWFVIRATDGPCCVCILAKNISKLSNDDRGNFPAVLRFINWIESLWHVCRGSTTNPNATIETLSEGIEQPSQEKGLQLAVDRQANGPIVDFRTQLDDNVVVATRHPRLFPA